MRNRIQVLLMFALSLVCLGIGLGVGIFLMGRTYHPQEPISSSNGRFDDKKPLIGVMLQLVLGLGGYILLANFIPGLVVLDMPLYLLRACVSVVCALCIVGCILTMYFMIEPRKTFDPSEVIGLGDPLLAAMGAYHFIGFLYLTLLCAAVLLRMFPTLNVIRRNMMAFTSRHRVLLFCSLMLIFG